MQTELYLHHAVDADSEDPRQIPFGVTLLASCTSDISLSMLCCYSRVVYQSGRFYVPCIFFFILNVYTVLMP